MERERNVSNLSQMLQEYKNSKIALYGLGTETEKVLSEIGQTYEIIGLLDGYREDGTLYGQKIISLAKAVADQVKLILVVARPGSCKAIAKRIGQTCIKHGIVLLDVRGKNLCETKKVSYSFGGAAGITEDALRKLAAGKEAVSVDLFDTLIMRQTMFPEDVLEIVDCRLKAQGIQIENFCARRLESEKSLSKFEAPSLVDIYSHMLKHCPHVDITPETLAEMEWQIDYGLLVPRERMCELISVLYGQGKAVYIVSDTYYSKIQLKKVLEKIQFSAYSDIFASCEHGTGKKQQLFRKVQERIGWKSCLHIGDDTVADGECAKKHGMEVCHVCSAMELFEMLGYLGMWDKIEELSDRIKTGMFVARLFNSPFQFERNGQQISVGDAPDIGYLFFAPVISDFILWFQGQVKRNHLENICFCARDGYLIKKMYDELAGDDSSLYFLTSRSAAIRAGMEQEKDIRYVEEMKFSGTLKEQLLERFGILAAPDNGQGLLDYAKEILERASIDRRGYQAYIGRLGMKKGDTAFFDFVAKGTCQMYMGRLLKNHLKGLYFLQLEEEYMRGKGLDIVPFYRADETGDSAIFENYYILETILTAPSPSVKGFDENGEPYYAKETREPEDLRCIQEVQDGILDYFRTYLSLCPKEARSENKALDEAFLSMIHGVLIRNEAFWKLKTEDPFFNRMTDMTNLI